MKNPLFKNAIDRVPQKTPPIWFMRQAGRYHSHYQALRAKHSFKELCLKPELAAEVAMGPIQDFDFDVAILFSDLLFPLDALGMGLDYTDAGPQLEWHLTPENIRKLKPWSEGLPDMLFQQQAMQITRERLPKNKSLIGFVGGLWTLFVYAVEGGHAGNLLNSKSNFKLFQQFSEILLPFLEGNIQMQLDGGAELVMIFDTAAGELSPLIYKDMVSPLLIKLSQRFPGKLGYYSKGTQADFFAKEMLTAPWAGFGVDHRWDLTSAFKLFPKGFVQGNFDQALLHADASDLKAHILKYLNALKNQNINGWVSGLGHGVLPKTPEKNVRLFIETVRKELS